MDKSSGKERRREKRAGLVGQVELYLNDEKKPVCGDLININTRAMAFFSDRVLESDRVSFFNFSLPGQDILKNVKGKIIRQEKIGDLYFTALSFINIPKAIMLEISKYINSNE